jgi:hypothetical protein
MRISCHQPVTARAIALSMALTAATAAPALADRKPPSACVGLKQGVCASRSECYWRKAITLKTGKVRRAHCRIRRSARRTQPPA